MIFVNLNINGLVNFITNFCGIVADYPLFLTFTIFSISILGFILFSNTAGKAAETIGKGVLTGIGLAAGKLIGGSLIGQMTNKGSSDGSSTAPQGSPEAGDSSPKSSGQTKDGNSTAQASGDSK